MFQSQEPVLKFIIQPLFLASPILSSFSLQVHMYWLTESHRTKIDNYYVTLYCITVYDLAKDLLPYL